MPSAIEPAIRNAATDAAKVGLRHPLMESPFPGIAPAGARVSGWRQSAGRQYGQSRLAANALVGEGYGDFLHKEGGRRERQPERPRAPRSASRVAAPDPSAADAASAFPSRSSSMALSHSSPTCITSRSRQPSPSDGP